MLGMLRRNDYDEPKVEGGGGRGTGFAKMLGMLARHLRYPIPCL